MQGKFEVVKCPGKLTGAQTATVLWDPAAGKRIELEFLRFTVTVPGLVKIFKNTDEAGNYIVNNFFDVGLSESYDVRGFKFAADDVIKVTTEAGDFYPTLAGREI